jgi:hypothetical protein
MRMRNSFWKVLLVEVTSCMTQRGISTGLVDSACGGGGVSWRFREGRPDREYKDHSGGFRNGDSALDLRPVAYAVFVLYRDSLDVLRPTC